MPPTTTSASLTLIFCAARLTDYTPQPQTTLMATASTSKGFPVLTEACLAGFCPSPA